MRSCSSSAAHVERVLAQRGGFEDRPARGERDQQREQQRDEAVQADDRPIHRARLIAVRPVRVFLTSAAASPSERSEWSSRVVRLAEGQARGRHAGDVVAAVERDVAREPQWKAAEHRHQPAVVGADEVHRLPEQERSGAEQPEHDERGQRDPRAAHARAPALAAAALSGVRPAGAGLRGWRRGTGAVTGRASVSVARSPVAAGGVRRAAVRFPLAGAPAPARTSSRRSSTTVMLSRPPAALAAAISASPASRR